MNKPSLQHPSRQKAEYCIAGLEIEDEREKAAIRKFYARERQTVHVTGKGLLLFFGWVLFYGLVIGGLIWWRNL